MNPVKFNIFKEEDLLRRSFFGPKGMVPISNTILGYLHPIWNVWTVNRQSNVRIGARK